MRSHAKGWRFAPLAAKSDPGHTAGGKMALSIKDIAPAIGAKAVGDTALVVNAAAAPGQAGPDALALAMTPIYGAALQNGQAQAAVLWEGADWQALGLKAAIFAPRARLAMAHLTQMLDQPHVGDGISPHAVIDPSANIGPDVAIGAFTVIGPGAEIAAGSWIADHVSIGAGVSVGEACHIHAGVRLQRDVRLGARVILQPNVVLGGDGFSFVSETPANVEIARETLGNVPLMAPEDATWHRIHSLGGVIIGDDVEIGANATVDAGTIRATQVGAGTKIDNLVQVGHNVIVGADCLLCAQAGVAGATVIGDRVVVGGKAGVADNLKVGDDVVLGGGAVVLSNVPSGRVMMGYPATKMQTHIASYKALRRLPRLLRGLTTRD